MFFAAVDLSFNVLGFDLTPAAGGDLPGTPANWKTQTLSGTIPAGTALLVWGFWVLAPSTAGLETLFDNVSVTIC
jgi:hypothetical protein